MERTKIDSCDSLEKKIEENVAKWQLIDNPIAALTDKQKDALYMLSDLVKEEYTLKPFAVFMYYIVHKHKVIYIFY